MGFITDLFGGGAEDAAIEAAGISAEAQREALAYLQEREALPQYYREAALSRMGGFYGLGAPGGEYPGATAAPGGEYFGQRPVGGAVGGVEALSPSDQRELASLQSMLAQAPQGTGDDFLDQINAQESGIPYMSEEQRAGIQRRIAELSPRTGGLGGPGAYYPGPGGAGPGGAGAGVGFGAILEDPFVASQVESKKQAAMEAILRSMGATGGLRSGTAIGAISRDLPRIEERAVSEYLQGLSGFTGLPSGAGEIAAGMAGIGQTQAQGITAGAQASQGALGNLIGTGLEIGKTLLMYSDRRLKDNVRYAGKHNGHNWYVWDWNGKAADIGLTGPGQGVMADEVEQYLPEAIQESQGYKTVDYSMLEIH